MREAGQLTGRGPAACSPKPRSPASTIKDLDKIVRKEYAKRGAMPTFLGYHGYPATVCVSVNEELVHGIPGDRVIKEGDIVSIDLGATYKGFVGDTAVTVGVGEITPEAQRLIDVTRESLWRGIRGCEGRRAPRRRLGAIGDYIESQGFGVVREYVGHGVGREMHEEPQVPNYGPPDHGPVLQQGHGARARAMVTIGDWHTQEARRRLDRQHAGRQPVRPLRAHDRDHGRRGRSADAAVIRRQTACDYPRCRVYNISLRH